MKSTKQMRLQLAKLLKLYAEKPTEEGIVLVSENDFELGSEIFMLTDEGEIETCPDGVYHAEDKTYTVADGLIASIEEKENVVEEVVEEEVEDIDTLKGRIADMESTIKEKDAKIENLEKDYKALSADYEKVKVENDTLMKTNGELQEQVEKLRKEIDDLMGKSGKPVVEETIEETVKEEDFSKQRQNANVNLIKKFRK